MEKKRVFYKKKLALSYTLLLIELFTFSLVYVLPFRVIAQPYLTENAPWQGNLTAVDLSAIALGDIDNDGDLDLALSGEAGLAGPTTKVYINNGTTLTENAPWQGNLTAVKYGSLLFGDINNDGKLDLILSGCNSSDGSYIASCGSGGIKSFIYTNNGTTLTENSTWGRNLSNVWRSGIALGDINNDGKLDLVLSGEMDSGVISKIYINNGTSLVENSTWQSNLTSVTRSSVILGDVDNDGDLDLALSGRDSGSNKITKIYTNNGSTFLENSTWQSNLANVDDSSLAFGDYDNDGDIDISLVGCCDIHRLYRNNGTTFIEIQREIDDLSPIFAGSQSFGDYDNDGDLDLVATGREGYTTLYLYNASNTNFTSYNQDPESHITDLYYSSIGWGDLDNDNDLDLIEMGLNTSVELKIKIYINNITTANTAPNASTSFSSSFANGKLTLTWGNGSDAETSANGLYYNLRVGTTSGGNQIVSGVYGGSSGGGGAGGGAAGYFGNMMQRKSISLSGLSASTTYYWSVQTIDTGLAKSNWSAEQNYTTAANIIDPVITLNTPINLYNTTNASFVFNVNVTDDSGLANVSLWGNWSGWHRNETNSSNLVNGTYTFSKNLSSYGDGFYIWAIRACDGYSNCIFSANRTFLIDNANPNITLISPSDASTWTSSSTVTFTYNVSDLAIANCSLIIDSSVVDTDTSVTVNTNQQFSRSLSNAAYTWSINCTDFTNHTSNSTTYSLTVSYTAPTTGGGGGGPSAGVTYNIGALTATGTTKQVGKDDSIKFKVNETEQTAKITTITTNNITFNISNIILILAINETKKLDLNADKIYDTSITLNSISDSKASLTFKSIYEKIPAEAPKEEEKPEEEIEEKKEEVIKEKRKPIWIPIMLAILIATYSIAYYFWKRTKKST